MKKTFFILIPSAVVLIYIAAQLMAHFITGRVFFSSLFIWELIIYALFGAMYIYYAVSLGDDYKYLRLAILGFILGAILFIIASMKLFLAFEFLRDLGI